MTDVVITISAHCKITRDGADRTLFPIVRMTISAQQKTTRVR